MLRNDPVRDILVAAFEVENEDIFHLKNLYTYVHHWLVEEGYYDPDEYKQKGENFEFLYFEKIKGDGNKEHHIWWRTIKIPSKSNYLRYFLKVDWQTLNMATAEIIHKGKKFGTNKGDLIIRIEAYVQIDYQNKWRTHWILKNFDDLFRKYIYKSQIEYHKDQLYKKSYKLQTFIKKYLQLRHPADIPLNFHPDRGVF